ncbi:response regulator [uncultured Selenomonas sp.]|uniref:response regulator n=1 Tax=uncultured Selenomonas sp. TaxID=159275 RepID=UPI0028D8076F|nr:response regulator [uncultured Selenomonas sp.]
MGKLRVLIVDDSKISRVMIAENLRDTDYEVCGMAADAVEALRLYEEQRPDLVTMDMNLPDANGLECSRRILALDKDARILMVSAMKDLNLITQGKAVGIRAFLQKPASKADLVDTLHLMCQATASQETLFRELYAKPFGRALQQGISGLLHMEGEADIAAYDPRSLDVSGAAVIIGITGFTTGRVILYVDESVIKLFAMHMLGRASAEEIEDAEAVDAVEEAANIIAGRAVSKINNVLDGKELRLTPPGTIRGSKVHIVSPRMTTFCISMQLPIGMVQMNVGFAEGE